jgi:hypothetical protein
MKFKTHSGYVASGPTSTPIGVIVSSNKAAKHVPLDASKTIRRSRRTIRGAIKKLLFAILFPL